MPYFNERLLVFCGLPCLIFLGGFTAKPECDTSETRNAVLKSVSDDHSNRLAIYAAKNSTANKDGAGKPSGESEQPEYALGEKIVTNSTSKDKRTLNCSGAISATVAGTKASKEVNFTVQQAADGKISVSVAPFQF
jgi:hypothetical protein